MQPYTRRGAAQLFSGLSKPLASETTTRLRPVAAAGCDGGYFFAGRPPPSSAARWHGTRSRTRRSRRASVSPRRSATKQTTVCFRSLGCPRNLVDTEVMAGLSARAGMEVTADAAGADYVVINTCGFLEAARDESRGAIAEALEGGNKAQKQKVLVTGCMANLHKDAILQEFPKVDAILGSGAVDQLVEAIQELEERSEAKQRQQPSPSSSDHHIDDSPVVRSARRRSFLERGDTPRFLSTPPHYAYLKIAEGCKKSCAFCVIPKIKGRLQSKPIPQVVDEFAGILDHGTASEVILIAQDLGDYGKDWSGEGVRSNKADHLSDLLQELLRAAGPDHPDLWLRLLYLYPDEITPRLVETMRGDDRICRYLDMPIQHSHDEMLRSMRRRTSARQIRDTIETLREELPGIHIRTSLMVGFPGETEEHFEDLLRFVEDAELENVGCFVYSDEPLAYSSKLPGKVPDEVKQERYDRLMRAQLDVVRRRNQQRVDRRERLDVVVEGLQDGHIVGRYYGQCPDIDGQVLIPQPWPSSNRGLCAGERYVVELTGFRDYDLIGSFVQ